MANASYGYSKTESKTDDTFVYFEAFSNTRSNERAFEFAQKWKNFRIRTTMKEFFDRLKALLSLSQTFCRKMYRNIARCSHFCKAAKSKFYGGNPTKFQVMLIDSKLICKSYVKGLCKSQSRSECIARVARYLDLQKAELSCQGSNAHDNGSPNFDSLTTI